MAAELSPWMQKFYDLLSDGLWRDREWVINQLIPLVPPGRAMRVNEKDRQRLLARGGTPSDQPRTKYRSTEYLVRSGARRAVVESLVQTRKYKRVEWREDPDGRVWVRRLDVPDPYSDTVPVAVDSDGGFAAQ
jgi:hypothetical protein